MRRNQPGNGPMRLRRCILCRQPLFETAEEPVPETRIQSNICKKCQTP
ncbi:MAG: hypothetical protein HPY50_17545 [Firmicutes bacterium]|nr:hypothetical protein [Bacillota bacterium]